TAAGRAGLAAPPAFRLGAGMRRPRHRLPGRLGLADVAFCGSPLFARRHGRLLVYSLERTHGLSRGFRQRGAIAMSASGGRTVRLFVETDLSAAREVRLVDERVHYLRDVLRLAPGASVDLFNGRDGEWRAPLVAIGKRQATLAVERQLRPQAS